MSLGADVEGTNEFMCFSGHRRGVTVGLDFALRSASRGERKLLMPKSVVCQCWRYLPRFQGLTLASRNGAAAVLLGRRR